MKEIAMLFLISTLSFLSSAQKFTRSELPTTLYSPWELTVGPNNFLWITEFGGKVSRVDPSNGSKIEVFAASDYFHGSPLENCTYCPEKAIGAGTFGLALHPDFSNPDSAFIYFVYSYNSGNSTTPSTLFRIKRLVWDEGSQTVLSDSNIVDSISNGFDHWGGRLLSAKQDGKSHLFLSVGDNGVSDNNPVNCYPSASDNPNNFTQDTNTKNGKIHRFNMDGTIPTDNPIMGNSFYTRGHRNPQGLAYNPNTENVYVIEHGDRTDDEINLLIKGMNYGWKTVRGFHDDGSFPGEYSFVSNYTPHPLINNDSLVEPIYSWCTYPQTSTVWTDWCTVAPSDGIYYKHTAIPEWTNSLLIVTLKDGVSTNKEVFKIRLTPEGKFAPSNSQNPNPVRYFGSDQDLNGRLRDIAVSNDGKTIYLINNGGISSDKITVYTYNEPSEDIFLYPNPSKKTLTINGISNWQPVEEVFIYTLEGKAVSVPFDQNYNIDVSDFANGILFIKIQFTNTSKTLRLVKN